MNLSTEDSLVQQTTAEYMEQALFAYRNKMLHNRFEWQKAERKAFARRILAEVWMQGNHSV